MSTNALFQLDQNESYALIDWKGENLVQSNYEELENVVRLLFKKEYTNMILNISKVTELDGYGVSAIRKGTKICSNESGLFVVVSKEESVVDRLDQAKIENLTIMNTVREGVDAIYLNDLENDFGDGGEEEENEFGNESTEYGEDY
ncbi:STAS domain-containing protein [Aquirufa ecclesiirivi]|uniref:Anti-anti-sigma factor n=1 Tax=Aquirufa ecclesiirivi TaxID=2715124 RepID=A0ABT4JD74_9BACT|nr:STAS domain-containing protein [Aquirufa ecclesiirivi]MCZ2472129.1 anti-anti-sigma factor [Aquirufa ecclesiirivi]MCZ2474193.1 anti-anti-sigma factor [Aquirufa ecclesiirivi]MDF0693837.1 anti-anti-sigma factor [Aquirufa ecclesiirivi]NHC48515.1 anti-anti-sigma factor [Aquirufa ecclesiirivi]